MSQKGILKIQMVDVWIWSTKIECEKYYYKIMKFNITMNFDKDKLGLNCKREKGCLKRRKKGGIFKI